MRRSGMRFMSSPCTRQAAAHRIAAALRASGFVAPSARNAHQRGAGQRGATRIGGRRFAVCSALIGRRIRRAPSRRRLPSRTGCSRLVARVRRGETGTPACAGESFRAPMAQPDTPDRHDNPPGQHAQRVRLRWRRSPDQHDNPPGQHAGGLAPDIRHHPGSARQSHRAARTRRRITAPLFPDRHDNPQGSTSFAPARGSRTLRGPDPATPENPEISAKIPTCDAEKSPKRTCTGHACMYSTYNKAL